MAIPNAPEAPIRVNPSAIPAAVYSLLRSVLSVLGSVAVSLHWIPPERLDGIVTMILVAASIGYGAWKHYKKSANLIVLEPYAPNSVAQVKS